MLDISVDLPNGIVTISPDDDSDPEGFEFLRMDIDKPGCVAFFGNRDNYVKVIPWTSIRQIHFQQLLPAKE